MGLEEGRISESQEVGLYVFLNNLEIFLLLFVFFLNVAICIHVCVQVALEAGEDIRSPGARSQVAVTGFV